MQPPRRPSGQGLAPVKGRVLGWLMYAAIGMTVLCLWAGVGQVSLFARRAVVQGEVSGGDEPAAFSPTCWPRFRAVLRPTGTATAAPTGLAFPAALSSPASASAT